LTSKGITNDITAEISGQQCHNLHLFAAILILIGTGGT
jgi:hypothetical protein